MTVTCLSDSPSPTRLPDRLAENCAFRIAPHRRGLARILAAAALTAVAVTACGAPAAPVTDTCSPVPCAADPTTAAAVDVQAPDGSVAGNGTYAVGDDIQPGTYKSAGPGDSTGVCYWARLKDTSGDMESILANDVAKGPQVVTIKKTDGAFSTRGCATWLRAS